MSKHRVSVQARRSSPRSLCESRDDQRPAILFESQDDVVLDASEASCASSCQSMHFHDASDKSRKQALAFRRSGEKMLTAAASR
jgi:hypothetical protein